MRAAGLGFSTPRIYLFICRTHPSPTASPLISSLPITQFPVSSIPYPVSSIPYPVPSIQYPVPIPHSPFVPAVRTQWFQSGPGASTLSSSNASSNGSVAATITTLQGNHSTHPTHSDSTPPARMTIPLPQLLFPEPFSRPSSLEALSHKLQSHFDSTSYQPHGISCGSSYGPHSHMAHHDSPHSSGSSLTSRANSSTEAQPQDVVNTITKKSSLKRKRDSKPSADIPPPEGTLKTTREAPKKKKANRGIYIPQPQVYSNSNRFIVLSWSACIHCQKAHLTCDDSRPCQRCVRRGMANTCTEGHRKKAKYLLDEDELGEFRPPPIPRDFLALMSEYAAALKKSKEKEKEAGVGKAPPPQAASASSAAKTPLSLRSQDAPTYSTNSQYSQGFGSEVANMEYSMLSAILGDQAHDDATLPNPPPRVNGHPLDLHSHSHRLVVSTDFGSLPSEQRWPSRELPPPQTPTGPLAPPQQQNTHPDPMYGQSGPVDVPMFGPDARGAPMPGPSMFSSLPQPDTSPLSSQPPPAAPSYLPPHPISSHSSGQVAVSANLSSDSAGTQLHGQQVSPAPTSHASNVYGTVTAPYDYTKVYDTPSCSPCATLSARTLTLMAAFRATTISCSISAFTSTRMTSSASLGRLRSIGLH